MKKKESQLFKIWQHLYNSYPGLRTQHGPADQLWHIVSQNFKSMGWMA